MTWLQERAHDDAAPPAPLPAVPASQHGLSAASAALAANAGVRSLFRAALASVAAEGLLPLPNASRLSDLMAALDPSWAVQRKKYAPFSRLFWAYAADVAAAGLALVPACDGFALIANGHGSGSGNGDGGGIKPGSAASGAAAVGAGVAPVVLRRAAVAEATDAQAAAIAASYEARLIASLSNGHWRLLSMLGDRDRGCPVPANLGCSLKQFIVARPARFELRWADEAWQVRLLPAPPRQPPQPPMQQQQQQRLQQQQQAPPMPPMQPMQPMPPMPIAPNPFAVTQQSAALPPRPAMPPPGFQQAASFSSILPPPGFAVAEPAAQAGPPQPASYSLFSAPFPFLPPPAASAQAAQTAAAHAGVAQQRHLYEPFVPYAPQPPSSLPANAVYAQSWEPPPQQPATSRAIFPSPMWSAAGREAPPLQRTVSAPAESYGAPSTQQQQQQAALLRNGAPLPAPQRTPGNGNTTSPRTGRVLPAPRLPAQNGGQKTLPQPRVLPPAPRPAGQAAPFGGYDTMADTGDADQDAARHEQLVAMLLDLDFD